MIQTVLEEERDALKMAKTLIFFWIILLSPFAVSYVAPDYPNIVEMEPLNPKIKEFDTLVLNCTMTSYYRGPCSVSDLFVQHNNENFRFPYVRAITNETAQFRFPNATVDNNGRFSCALPEECYNSSDRLSAQYVHVARIPLKPFLINCTVDNWEFLVCTWGPSKSVQDNHTHSPKSLKQILWWQHPGDGSNWNKCPAMQQEQCFWRSSYFTMEEYCVKIVVWNGVSPNISSEVECRIPELIVKPRPPTNIRKMTTLAADDGRNLSFEWDAPIVEKRPLVYNVTVRSRWRVLCSNVVSDTSLSISAIPFTDYDVCIVASPSGPGFSSDRACARLSTVSAVPSENPLVMANFYSVNSVDKSLVLYWQPISEENYCGPKFCYYIHDRTWSSSSASSQCIESHYSTGMNWNGAASDLLIVSRNEVGSALLPSSAIHVPSHDNLFSDVEVVAEGHDRNVSLEWFIGKTSADREMESIMLFWCKLQSVYQVNCKTPIQWQTIDVSQHDINLSVDDDFRKFQFGVSVKFTDSSFSGIKWAKKKCSSTKAPEPPNTLKVSAVVGKHDELQVSWREPRYDESGAFIRSFVIFYCSVDDQKNCLHDNQSVTVFKYLDHVVISGDGDGSFILKGLNSDTNYKVWMISNARQGSSRLSAFATGSTTQPWFTPGKIVGIIIGILLAASIVIFGLYITFRCCDKYRKKFSSGFQVSLPPQRFQLPSTSSEVPMLGNHALSEYYRQPSQVSTNSRDSGHYSFPPSSPAMLPLLSDVNDSLKRHADGKRNKNCYHPTNFNGIEKIEDIDGSVGSALGVMSYKVVPSPRYEANQFDQAQLIPPEQVNCVEYGAMSTNSNDRFETGNGGVNYCNDFDFSNASNSSDIGYTRIEQLPTMSNQSNELTSGSGRNEDSNLLLRFDHQRSEEFDSSLLHSTPVDSHLNEPIVSLNEGQSLADGLHSDSEPLAISSGYPNSGGKTAEEGLILHSTQLPAIEEVKASESTIRYGNVSIDNGYLPHNRLFGIE